MLKRISFFTLSIVVAQSQAMLQPYQPWVQQAALIHIKTTDRNISFSFSINEKTTIGDIKWLIMNHRSIPYTAQRLAPSYANPWLLWLVDKVGAPQPDTTSIQYLMNRYNSNRLMLTLSTLVNVPERYRSIYTQKK